MTYWSSQSLWSESKICGLSAITALPTKNKQANKQANNKLTIEFCLALTWIYIGTRVWCSSKMNHSGKVCGAPTKLDTAWSARGYIWTGSVYGVERLLLPDRIAAGWRVEGTCPCRWFFYSSSLMRDLGGFRCLLPEASRHNSLVCSKSAKISWLKAFGLSRPNTCKSVYFYLLEYRVWPVD